MKLKSLIYIVLLTGYAYAQEKVIDIPANDQSRYTAKQKDSKRMQLTDLKKVNQGKHWRFWINKYIAASYIIDIYGKDSLNCIAFVTQYVYGDLDDSKDNRFTKLYHERIAVDQKNARILYRAALAVDVNDFSILERNGSIDRIYTVTDSEGPIVEFADEHQYLFKTGLKPNNRIQFNQFVNIADKLLNFEKLKNEFEKNIPLGYYGSAKWTAINKPLTEEQRQKYIKYWREHVE